MGRLAEGGRLFPATREHGGGILIYSLEHERLFNERKRRDELREENNKRICPRSAVDTALLEAWADLLQPMFGDGESCNLTGTYSDAYGYSHGCMLVRNVVKDFRAFLRHLERSEDASCIGVEYHPSGRNILHFHALLGGRWTDGEILEAQYLWTMYRGWGKAKRVVDREGCVKYAAKHLLKQGAADSFEFFLPAPKCRHEWRRAEAIARLRGSPGGVQIQW